MNKTIVPATLLFLLSFSAAAIAGDVKVYLPLPPPPTVVISPGPHRPAARSVVVMPPLPPSIVIAPGPPEYWFWDDRRAMWFYYDRERRPHYSRRHAYVDDGRHYYAEEGNWRVGHEDMGRHRGWYKHERYDRRERERERRHDNRDRGRHHGYDD